MAVTNSKHWTSPWPVNLVRPLEIPTLEALLISFPSTKYVMRGISTISMSRTQQPPSKMSSRMELRDGRRMIYFRGSDIKDLQVKLLPPTQTKEQIYTDPAIIQSHTGVPASSLSVASVGRSYPSISSSYQSVSQPGQSKLHHVTQKVMHLYGYSGMSISNPQHHVAVQPPVRSQPTGAFHLL